MFGDLLSFENSLLGEFQRLQREVDELFSPGWGLTSIRAVASGAFPSINIGVRPESVEVYAFAPGLDMQKLDLSIQRNLLTISGERKIQELPAENGAGYYLRERFNGAFRRVVSLPEDADPDQVKAQYENGILTVTIGKQEAAKPRQIQVNNA
jgi:HSP20 family protein